MNNSFTDQDWIFGPRLKCKFFKFLPLADSLEITKFMKTESLPGDYMDRIFILENKSHLGFKKDLMKSCEGLDYEHSVLGILFLLVPLTI